MDAGPSKTTRARPKLSMFGPGEIERLHEASLRLLAEVGVRFRSPKARAILSEAGAKVDSETEIVRIPPKLVEWAFGRAPSEFLLAGRDRQTDCRLGGGRTFVTLGGVAPGTLDHRTGERRQATTQDLAEAMLVADALPEIDFQWPIVSATDSRPKLQELRSLATMLANTGKHVQAELLEPLHVPFALEIVRRAASDGSFDPKQPIFSNLYCPVSPLQHEEGPLDAALLLAKEGVPQTIFTLPLAGATSPVTLAGTMVQANCELLSTFVVLQLAAPGCPLVYVANAGIMDMRSGTFAMGGSEICLLNIGLTELGRRYGFPVLTIGFYTDDKTLSVHAGIDSAPSALTAFLLRPDIISGPGLIDTAMLLYLPKLILDAEITRICERMAAGVECDDEHLLVDLIASVGPGGHFLKAKETSRYLRAGEHAVPQLLLRSNYEAWLARPQTELDRAKERVDDILRNHKPMPLPDPDGIEDVLERADDELAEE